MIINMIGPFGLLVFLLWGMLLLSFSTPTPLSATGPDNNSINCDLHHNNCTKRLSDFTVTLDVKPKPVRAMTDLLFTVTLSGNLPANASPPYIDLGMPGMNMGPNRVILKSTGTGVYEGRGIIVHCPSGRKIWRATVNIPNSGRAEFVFHVIY
jgi:hypothetical protein